MRPIYDHEGFVEGYTSPRDDDWMRGLHDTDFEPDVVDDVDASYADEFNIDDIFGEEW